MNPEHSASVVTGPVAKALSVWALFGLTSWAEVASMLAALYTAVLLLEWIFNKFIRPACARRGWLKRRIAAVPYTRSAQYSKSALEPDELSDRDTNRKRRVEEQDE